MRSIRASGNLPGIRYVDSVVRLPFQSADVAQLKLSDYGTVASRVTLHRGMARISIFSLGSALRDSWLVQDDGS
ncbi:hypothetical protein [Puniceicoccus vermicola]|uniref:Uncharacterized protein n=1 Tax=Puniceicoccus vermicola TaxID=388746 RepID=A0A7X1B396_9BACT|nr:hypothetical protein [Puniceicoccus vermicola]MBC2603733.1 hypothetical protein [Puniceicoccus vermicola]